MDIKEMINLLAPSVFGLLGVVVGGVVAYFGNYKVKKLELEHQIKREELNEKRKLYGEFVKEVNIAGLKSIASTEDWNKDLEKVNSLVAQIEITSSKEVYKLALQVTNAVNNLYAAAPNPSARSLKDARASFINAVKCTSSDLI
ncbi:hypothetical protein [Alteromonas confluentis]|uniref:DUF1043 domain-containing protein n=1 Tax=Alteromonas confluentis TaxID=1656094 RepID=A0A1E7ZGV2_9ALTE|nr:hypothetical protein [Alteromonas confluentis]OFC72748.1 hypothetical protein BFC18_00010 [Alteromonas confluentis]